jgi:hypothetical protein
MHRALKDNYFDLDRNWKGPQIRAKLKALRISGKTVPSLASSFFFDSLASPTLVSLLFC